MTNKEKYRRAFSCLRVPEGFSVDQKRRKREKRSGLRQAVAAAVVMLAVCAAGVSAYAADLGGIQRTVQVWLLGDQTDAVITIDEEAGTTLYSLQADDGRVVQSGGGVAMGGDGGDRPLTESEMQDYLNYPDKEVIDGRIYLFYKGQKTDITDRFDTDGLCFLTISDGRETLYVTVTRNAGLPVSTKRYVQKEELPEEWFR